MLIAAIAGVLASLFIYVVLGETDRKLVSGG